MTAKELQKRGAKAECLRVLQTEDGSFYVESAEGKILYRVIADDQETSCTCADFTRNSKKDPDFQCKHILSVFNCVPNGEVEPALYLERKKPKLDERWIIEIEGNQFVKYAGLLDLGHQKGISASIGQHKGDCQIFTDFYKHRIHLPGRACRLKRCHRQRLQNQFKI
jgi:hypothetical protein